MTRRIRTTAMWTVLIIGGGLSLATHPAQAQGPYGRNSYEDFPFNQGSLFYRPLKPNPRPRPAPRQVVRPYSTPTQGAYTYSQPYTYAPQGGYYYNPQTGYYYYYPANPAPSQPTQVAPGNATPAYRTQPTPPR